MMLGTRISRDKKPTLQLLTHRKFVPVAFMCEPYRLISRLANEQNAGRAPVRRDGEALRHEWGPRSTLHHYGYRVALSPLFAYYEGIDRLSDQLTAVGAHDWADALTRAIRGGFTSGEILSNAGVVLRDLARSPDVERYNVEEEVTRLQGECRALWDGANR